MEEIMMTAMDKRYILGLDEIVNLKDHFIVKYGDVIVRSVCMINELISIKLEIG